MNSFDRRWQSSAARVRETAPLQDQESLPPFGFATRVLARAWSTFADDPPLEQIWTRYAWRALAAVAALWLFFATIDTFSTEHPDSLLPRIDFPEAEPLGSP